MNRELEELIEKVNSFSGISKKQSQKIVIDFLEDKENKVSILKEIISDLEGMNMSHKLNTFEIETDSKELIVVKNNLQALKAFDLFKNNKHVFNLKINKPSELLKVLSDKEVLNKIKDVINEKQIEEVIFFLSSSTESDVIIRTVTNELAKSSDIKISRLATGIPHGSSIEYIDEETIKKAIDRREKI